MAKWQKIKPYDGPIRQGCLHAPAVEKVARLDMLVAVGFGEAHISKDNEVIFQEKPNDETYHQLSEFEEMAKLDPDHDWRLYLFAPLRGEEYQRQSDGLWVLIDSNKGFA